MKKTESKEAVSTGLADWPTESSSDTLASEGFETTGRSPSSPLLDTTGKCGRECGSAEGIDERKIDAAKGRPGRQRLDRIADLCDALKKGARFVRERDPGKANLFLYGAKILRSRSGAVLGKSASIMLALTMLLGAFIPFVNAQNGEPPGVGTPAITSYSNTPSATAIYSDFILNAKSVNLTVTTTTYSVSIWTEEYLLRVEYATHFVNYTIQPYFSSDFIWYRRIDGYYDPATYDEKGNDLDNVEMTISNWGRNGNSVWFNESCPEFSLIQSFTIFRDYFELNVTYQPGTKKVLTTYFIALCNSQKQPYSMISSGRYYRYVPGAPENTPSSNALGGWYPCGYFAPVCDMRAHQGSSLGVEWGYNETVAFVQSPQYMALKNPFHGESSVFGLKYTSINSVVPNVGLGKSKTFHTFVRPYQYSDGKDRGYDVGYAQWVAPRIASYWGNHNTPSFPLTVMNIGAWTSDFRNWIENSEVKVACYSNNLNQVNWNYKSASAPNLQNPTPARVPNAWEMWDKSQQPYLTTGGLVQYVTPVSGPYTASGTFRWHLIQNDSYMSWWTGTRGVFWDMMDSWNIYTQPRNDYQNKTQFVYEGYLDLVRESYASYWDYVISNSYYGSLHLAIASDLTCVEGWEPTSIYGTNMKGGAISLMNFVNNIPSQQRPQILIYQYYSTNSTRWQDQNSVYSALFGSARYEFHIDLYSYSPYASQLKNLKMAEEMFKAMGCTRNNNVRIDVGTLDLTSEGSALTTSARMVVTNGTGSPTISFTSPYDDYTITNLNASANTFNLVIPSSDYYMNGSNVQTMAPMTFGADGKGTFHGKILAEKTGEVTKRNDLKVVHTGVGAATVELLKLSSSSAELRIGATGGTTTVSIGGLIVGKTYEVYVNSVLVYSEIADSQGFITFSRAYGSSDSILAQEGSGVDTNPPSISSTAPSDKVTNVEVTQNITLTFTEKMNKTSAESAFTMEGNGLRVAGTFSWRSQDTILVFTPAIVLAYSTRYYVNISTSAKDVSGNSMASFYHLDFTSKDTSDTVSPTVTAVYPLNGAVGVSTHPTIVVTFSEWMNPGVTSASFHLSSSDGTVTGSTAWMDNNTTLVFVPSSGLMPSKAYTITIDAQAEDIFGNNLQTIFTSAFTTQVNQTDTTPPTVTSTVPTAGASGIEVTQNIILTFSEKMNKTSVETSFALKKGVSNVNGYFSWNPEATSCVFTPFTNLDYSTAFSATLSTYAKDFSGNRMVSPLSLSFTTRSESDVSPPAVTEVYPSNMEENISIYATVVVSFSEPMDTSSASAAYQMSSQIGTVAGMTTWSGKNTTLIFTPSEHLIPSSVYIINIDASASDVFGNRMTQAYSFSFLTRNDSTDTAPPTINHQPSGNAEVGSSYNLTAVVTDVSRLSYVTVTFVDVNGMFNQIAMGLGPSVFSAAFPPQNAAGTIRYYIEAQDEYGNRAITADYSLLVQDTTIPAVSIAYPESGSTISNMTNIETIASDNYGISSVEFFVDDVSVLNDSIEPYVLAFNPRSVVDGYHTIRVVAYDLTGLSEHDAIEIVVQNLDVTPPTVKRVSPANGAMDVEPTTRMLVEFSETMYASSTESAISLETNGTRMDLNITWLNETTLTMSLPSDLDYSSRYWLNITTDAMDSSGTPLSQDWSSIFDTGAGPDIGRPTVLWHSPSEGETGVSPSATMSILFSEAMSQSSVESAFSLAVGTEKASGGFKWSLDSTLLEFRPSTNLSDSMDYNMFVTSMAVDLAGNAIDTELRVTFTTRQTEVFSGVSGIVTDGTMPIAGVLITDGYRVVNSTQDGRFVLANVPAGSYSLSASKWNYSSSELVKITLGKGQVISGLQFTLSTTPGVSTITGVVFSSSNNTLEGALVSIGATGNVAFTDENGRFILSDVVPGRYSLEVSKLFYTTRTIGNVDVANGENSKIVSIDLSSNPNSGSPSDVGSGTIIIGDFTIPIAVGAGVLALAGGMVMRKSWRSDRKEVLRKERILRDISGQNGDATTLEGLDVTPRVIKNAAANPDFKTLDSLVDLVVSNEPIPKKKVVSILDPKGDEDFVRGLKELERLR
jgi:methionine-rich copper-binding protein CopC